MKKILVSFITPTHNNSTLLEKTLAGFINQTHHNVNFEIIIVDNNSKDEAIANIQREYRRKIPLTLIQQPNLPHPFALCRARNIGLQVAEGEWIITIDSDTIPNKKYLSTLSTYLTQWGDKPVISTGERIFVSAEKIKPSDIVDDPYVLEGLVPVKSHANYGLTVDRRLPAMMNLPNVDFPWDFMHGCNVIYRKDNALSIGGYDETYDGHWGYEDIDFAYRMITQAACTPYYVPGLHVYHQDVEDDVSAAERYIKNQNPNWARICNVIPKYREYKVKKFSKINSNIKV